MTNATNSEARPEWEPVAWRYKFESAWADGIWMWDTARWQGQNPIEVRALYSPAVHTEMLRAQESERVLRQIVSECAAALGTSSGCAPEASLEFMRLVPAEIQDTIAALREALAAPVVAEWIAVSEEMPIPGKPVLACYKNGRKIIAFWTPAITVESDEDSVIGVYNEATDTYYDPEGWYECVENWDEFSSIFVDAGVITHWMELPDAPEPEEQT